MSYFVDISIECDARNHPWCKKEITFTRNNKRNNYKAARKAGWKRKGGEDICPGCIERQKAQQPPRDEG